jgi:nucleoside-diphosphate-sugar epimerase
VARFEPFIKTRLENVDNGSAALRRRAQYDLTCEADVGRLFAEHPVEVVLHLAADVGGIAYNLATSGHTFSANAMMTVRASACGWLLFRLDWKTGA